MRDPLLSAAAWFNAVMTGPIAVSIGVIAIAFFGFEMLGGFIDFKKGLKILLGMFMLFGAPQIAAGLMEFSPRSTEFISEQNDLNFPPSQNPPKSYPICWTC